MKIFSHSSLLIPNSSFNQGDVMYINVIGAGLAGCEAAWQIAK